MVALLAPVPEEHLVSALDVVREHKKVAFRSRSWQLFRQIDELRGDAPADVLIYASHSTVHHSPPTVSWRAKYIGQREARGGAHPDGMTYRPLSTTEYPDDNKGHGLFSGKSVIWSACPLNHKSRSGPFFNTERPNHARNISFRAVRLLLRVSLPHQASVGRRSGDHPGFAVGSDPGNFALRAGGRVEQLRYLGDCTGFP
jgi:hypothetical protein